MKLYQKIKKIIIIVIITYIFSYIFIPPLRARMIYSAYDIFSTYLDEIDYVTSKDSKEKEDRGEPRYTINTLIIWNKKYEIRKINFGEDKALIIYDKGAVPLFILEKVKKYEKRDNKLFVLSEDGIAVIDKKNILRAYIIAPEEEFKDKYIKKDYIKYLSDFDEFTEKEQDIIKSLI